MTKILKKLIQKLKKKSAFDEPVTVDLGSGFVLRCTPLCPGLSALFVCRAPSNPWNKDAASFVSSVVASATEEAIRDSLEHGILAGRIVEIVRSELLSNDEQIKWNGKAIEITAK